MDRWPDDEVQEVVPDGYDLWLDLCADVDDFVSSVAYSTEKAREGKVVYPPTESSMRRRILWYADVDARLAEVVDFAGRRLDGFELHVVREAADTEEFTFKSDLREPVDWHYYRGTRGKIAGARTELIDAIQTLSSCDAAGRLSTAVNRSLRHAMAALALTFSESFHWEDLAKSIAKVRSQVRRAAHLARKAGDTTLADSLDALLGRFAPAATALASVPANDEAEALPLVRALAPPGRAPTAVPILSHAPPAIGVSVAA